MTHTPLTLEFEPETVEGRGTPAGFKAQAIIEPSVEVPGRIFAGIHPFGGRRRLGLHLSVQDARRIRNHLTKLLLDPPDPEPESVPEPVQSRIQRAVERAKKRKRSRWFLFRLEFQLGSIQGVLGRLRD